MNCSTQAATHTVKITRDQGPLDRSASGSCPTTITFWVCYLQGKSLSKALRNCILNLYFYNGLSGEHTAFSLTDFKLTGDPFKLSSRSLLTLARPIMPRAYMARTCLQNLPLELVCLILETLEMKDLLACTQVPLFVLPLNFFCLISNRSLDI